MHTYILSGILYCGNCGSKMIGVCEGKKGNWTGYRCKKKASSGISACNMRNVSASKIEDATFKDVIKLFLVPQNVRIIFQRIKEILDRSESQIQKEFNKIESEIKEIEESIKRYTEGFEKGLLDAVYFSERNNIQMKEKEKYERKKNNLSIKMEEINDDIIYFYQFKKYLYNIKLSAENRFLNDTLVKRNILRTLIRGEIIKKITILTPRLAKIKYDIEDQLTEKIINYKSRVKSINIGISNKYII
ncbi:hypothetical protein AMJ80_03070 [bacterium SM23_31]|nr:MAG: hypothetical protein AMJ80_03070 [bacterium SM23_31]